MIRVVATVGNRRTVLLGLSEENLRRLRAGQPIVCDLQALQQGSGGDPLQDLVILAGANEAELQAELRSHGLAP